VCSTPMHDQIKERIYALFAGRGVRIEANEDTGEEIVRQAGDTYRRWLKGYSDKERLRETSPSFP
jgi:hypothetical protein